MLKTLDVSNIRYSNESMFVKETARGYQYFLRYSYANAFYSTSRMDFARCLPSGIIIDDIAPKKHNQLANHTLPAIQGPAPCPQYERGDL